MKEQDIKLEFAKIRAEIKQSRFETALFTGNLNAALHIAFETSPIIEYLLPKNK